MALRRLEVTQDTPLHPAYVVWELTLACDQPCTHCGSRAGDARANELSTDAALKVVAQLAAAGAREVVLIGGEAYLHPGFLDIIAALARAGVRPTMTTGGRGITPALAASMKAAGLYSASVSIDGLERTHDLMRACRGSFASATAALRHLRAAGVLTASNININRLNAADLEGLYDHLAALGISAWQVQITAPLGRAADRPDMLLQPWDLLDVVPRVAALKIKARAAGILVMPGNNLGYFGPEEAMLRSLEPDGRDHWQGCQAGRFVMGIESDGAVKGCPSLQTSHYVGGNIQQSTLADIWNHTPELAFARRGPSTICGASAAPAPSPRPAWAAAPSPPTPSSAGRATTPTATIARAPSPAPGAASGWSPRRRRRARRSTTGPSTSSKSRSTRPIPARRRRRRW